MPRISQKFIDRKVRRPMSGQVIYRDDELIGFGLRVTRGSMSYIVECRVNGINRRITIGPHGPFDPDSARAEARKLLATMILGRDPKAEEAKEKLARITVAEVFEDYLKCKTLRPNSVRAFRALLRRCLGDWLELPITDITKDMVETRHRDLTKPSRMGTSGKAQANKAMEILSILLNFAMNKYEIEGQPIIQKNPVDRLTQIRAWHRLPRRQNVIPEHKLREWYQAVMGLRDKKIRDYLLFLLFTGLRRMEAATLKWTDIDFDTKVITIRSEHSKNHLEHHLPITEFLQVLLLQRKTMTGESEFVFPGRTGHMVDSDHVIGGVAKNCDYHFTLHDLRRTFLTTAEMLEVPHYALKKLANHTSGRDITSGYVVVTVARLRVYMTRISDHFVDVLGVDISDFT
ncbi:MAG TPA: tyrosine-type recombinase/integrase [Candidatus Obscuribacterales bacterium]